MTKLKNMTKKNNDFDFFVELYVFYWSFVRTLRSFIKKREKLF